MVRDFPGCPVAKTVFPVPGIWVRSLGKEVGPPCHIDEVTCHSEKIPCITTKTQCSQINLKKKHMVTIKKAEGWKVQLY